MKELLFFIGIFIITFILYYILLRSTKKRKKKEKNPVEIDYIIKKYNLNMKKIKYNRLALMLALVNAFDISIIVTIISNIKSTVLQVLCAIVIIMPIIIVSYSLVGKYYKKKGMTNDES